ncbi:unnamed protein product [Prunus armeniaca]
MKQEGWIGALMKRKELVHKSKSKVGGYVGIYKTRVDMWFAYQGMSRIQGSKKAKSKEFDMGDLSSTQEARGFLPWWSSWELLEQFPRG